MSIPGTIGSKISLLNFRLAGLWGIIGIFILFSSDSFARSKKYLRIGKQKSLDSAGIRLKVFRDADSRPLPALSSHTLVSRDNSAKIEVYNPRDLWMRNQYLAGWGNEIGSVRIGKLFSNFPVGVPRLTPQYNLVLKEAFEKWQEGKEPSWDEEQVKTWVEQFAKGKIKGEPKPFKGPKGCECQLFRIQGEEGYQELYLVNRKKAPKGRYAFLYSFSGENLAKSRKAILQSIKSLAFFAPKNLTKTKLLTTRRSKKKKRKDWTPEYIASRERVIKNIEHLDRWRYTETDNFIIVSDMKLKKSIDEIQVDLEKARKVYRKYFPIRKPLKAVSVVRVFNERRGYVAYVGKELEWSGGLWAASKKELIISPVDWLSGMKRRKEILRVIYHEGFHQYIYYVTEEVHTSPWFNEGHAAYFEGLKFRGKKAKIELSEDKFPHFQNMLKSGDIDIKPLLKMSLREYYNPDTVRDNYSLGWALTYFLQKGAPVMKEKNNYPQIISRYYDCVLETKNPAKATQVAWEGVDMEKFTKDFIAFWNSRRMLAKSKAYDPISEKK